ncbi:2OG-Fe(II) oxygenase [Aquimarina sp. MMG016]|uniref:2OG-Fe(II) oxygenase n=1 Tax=Aquimarina sp. MMG016 TaxID=2822690 RepID=UPI001B3A437B|nr:2OG-Fe(II) oxygenase [Aquimarina sp. MMG016]MBQ4822193.1 2OG-Fe(II) oxygenase [Aquimarina sp. MMG016]
MSFIDKQYNRDRIAEMILESLNHSFNELQHQFEASKSHIGYFFLDNVLPMELAKKIYDNFPSKEEVYLKKSIREFKYVTAQMNKYHPLLEEVIYAFQDNRVVDVISKICGCIEVQPDDNLYAGGISMMGEGNYLNPHLDNSHDKDRNLWRALNLLYYVTPEWSLENGGNLELWPNGIGGDPLVIESKFNRLVVMSTHKRSWHSVNEVRIDSVRCCVSNYYFSKEPIDSQKGFHVTTFRARPGQYFKNKVLQIDSGLRMALRKVFKKGVKENPHVYKKNNR